VTPEEVPGGPVRASRAERAARRRRGRMAVALGLVVMLVAAGLWWVLRPAGTSTGGSSGSRSASGGPAAPRLLAFNLTGGSAPYLAVIGSAGGGHPAATMPVPVGLSIVVPGQGETLAPGVAELPGASMQVALANEVGAWTPDFVEMDLEGFARMVDRAGGVTVHLPLAVVTPAGVLGPGDVELNGTKAAALMRAKSGDPDLRWATMLTSLLAAPPTLQTSDVLSSTALPSVQRTLDGAAGAQTVPMPTETIAGTVEVSQQPALDQLVGATWGTPTPVPAIVQNGNGAPGVGEQVARRIIPAGFRVVLSQNAQSFDIPSTDIFANGKRNVPDAQRAREALGIGQVLASSVPSGVGDITIVVGKDFTA
jgi:LytR cell envelope-related transcriptional attenuator/LytR_cpsA_psr family